MNSSKRVVLVGSSLVAALAMAGCGGTSSYAATGCSDATAVATTSVTIQASAFSPNCIKVAAGNTVTFTNRDSIIHTVTAEGAPADYDSGHLNPGQIFQHAFSTLGNSTYVCQIHPGMKGTVIVQ
jgi:plastocyanin